MRSDAASLVVVLVAGAGCAAKAPARAPAFVAAPPPEPPPPTAPAPDPHKFDGHAAAAAYGEAAAHARRCMRWPGPRGLFAIAITFAPDGHVSKAEIEGHVTNGQIDGPFERVVPRDEAVRACVERAFREAHVPPFEGEPVTWHPNFMLERDTLDHDARGESR